MRHCPVKTGAPRWDPPRKKGKADKKAASTWRLWKTDAWRAMKRPGALHVLVRSGPCELSWASDGIYQQAQSVRRHEEQHTGVFARHLSSSLCATASLGPAPGDTDVTAGSDSYNPLPRKDSGAWLSLAPMSMSARWVGTVTRRGCEKSWPSPLSPEHHEINFTAPKKWN